MARTAGSRTRRPVVRTLRYRIWQTIRVYRRAGHVWTAPEVAATAEAGIDNVRLYVRGLLRHAYLHVVTPKREGARGGHARYRLIRDTGPEAPILSVNGSLYDPNTDEERPAPERKTRRQEARDER